MLKIRKEQMDAMAYEAFARQMTEKLRSDFAEDIPEMTDGELLERVRAAIGEGRTYGLTWESSLAPFAVLSVVLGPDFHKHPKIRGILSDQTMPPDERGNSLIHRLTRDDWDELAMRGHKLT